MLKEFLARFGLVSNTEVIRDAQEKIQRVVQSKSAVIEAFRDAELAAIRAVTNAAINRIEALVRTNCGGAEVHLNEARATIAKALETIDAATV